LTTDTTTGAGFFFTPELYDRVVMGLLAASGVLEADPTVITTNHLRPVQVPVLQVDAVSTAGTEGSAATDTNTEGDAITLGAFRFDGAFSCSAEVLMASEFDLENLLSTFAIRATANRVAAQLALGAGTTAPTGLFTAGKVTSGVTASGTTDVTPDEVLALVKSVPKGYRKTSKLVVSDALHTLMLQWKNEHDDYLLRSLDGGGYQFAGLPLFTEPAADQTSISAAEVHAVAGDFSGYFVRTTPLFFKRTDGDDPLNPRFTFALWLDAQIVDANALRSLVMHA
jgi:HK97 family phage major capsid protein